MTSNSNSLYGKPRPKPTSTSSNLLPSSSTLAFTTHLASLISKESDPSTTTRGRPRPSKTSKSDIFTKHNKGAQKRAAKDEAEDDDGGHALRQVHQRSEDIGTVDAATLHRSKKRMEEKARIYEDLKSGLYLAVGSGDEDEEDDDIGPRPYTTQGKQENYLTRLRRKEREGLIDFDRKWADEERAKRRGSDSNEDEDDEDEEEEDDDNASIISYEDELGRTRHGTRAQAARAARLKRQESQANDTEQEERWKPARPQNLIFGPTIQAEAFNPSAPVAEQMSYLASRRDRSPTPPEQTHYDADAEVRNRGTGFYAFSKDEETRQREMEELMNTRAETQREREARLKRKAERERMKVERRKKIEELRVKRRAEVFLAGLGDLGVQVDG